MVKGGGDGKGAGDDDRGEGRKSGCTDNGKAETAGTGVASARYNAYRMTVAVQDRLTPQFAASTSLSDNKHEHYITIILLRMHKTIIIHMYVRHV
ncbi:hypothetical protein QTP88_007294 [Uroleucon formosanum]